MLHLGSVCLCNAEVLQWILFFFMNTKCFHVVLHFCIQINSSPYKDGWIIKVEISDNGELNNLMDSDQYSKFCEEEDSKHWWSWQDLSALFNLHGVDHVLIGKAQLLIPFSPCVMSWLLYFYFSRAYDSVEWYFSLFAMEKWKW